MFPFQIRPDDALQEIQDFGTKLGQGIKNLTEMGEIDVGACTREPVYQEDKLVLYRFNPKVEITNPVPLLIIYALVNRPYMADLQKGRSLVEGLLNRGIDVYLIDWGYPDAGDRYLTLDDYIDGYIDRCVDAVTQRHNLDKINILGICQGGAFSLCYTSMYPEKVRNLVTTVTPVDFHTKDDLLSHWVRNVNVDLLVDTLGNVPGELLNWTFLSLKPYQLTGQKYLDMVDALKDPEQAKNFMRMEKWIFDSPDQVGETFRQFIRDFYQRNGFVEGGITINGHAINLKSITCPVLNIFAASDHLVPPDASRKLEQLVGSKDYTALEFPGGHIGIYVSGKAQKMIPPAVADWLAER